MGPRYHIEYDLGRWGGRVRRSHGGLRAILAIAVDLLLGLVLGAVWFALGLAWVLARTTIRFAFELIRAPVRAARWALGQVRRIEPPRKPAYAGFDDLL